MVIAIIIVVMAMALPNFVAMMRTQKWSGAVGNIQIMVMRARALATNVRKDFSVEFDISDNRTIFWIESESNLLERCEDLNQLKARLGGGAAGSLAVGYIADGDWYNAGYRKQQISGTDEANYPPYGPPYTPPNAPSASGWGDNARQCDCVTLGFGMTIDMSRSVKFISWDAPTGPLEPYGKDNYPDIRLSSNGALVEMWNPVICIKDKDRNEFRKYKVVRCTARLSPTR
jgi:type II secretory pathway pseudopilin PulG